ncbi:MAG: hypothetical protein L6R48_15605 [Planctomycetes bacterium]|jgi:hypothetical protein|nr:hypothetical protein [Planctomycetota bacterium]
MADPLPDDPGLDPEERRASQALLGALRDRRQALDGLAGAPADDKVLSERILAEARERSARISGGGRRSSSATAVDHGRPIPWWLWLAWALAAAAAVVAWKMLA